METPLRRKDDAPAASRYRCPTACARVWVIIRGRAAFPRPHPDIRPAGAVQRGVKPWPDATANPRPHPSPLPRSPSPAPSSGVSAPASPDRRMPRPTPSGIGWRVVSPAATGPSTPAMATRVGCSSPRARGPAMAEASSPRRPTWPPARSRSRSPRGCWPIRARAPGRSAVADSRVRLHAPWPMTPWPMTRRLKQSPNST